jgi:hypothetical protein
MIYGDEKFSDMPGFDMEPEYFGPTSINSFLVLSAYTAGIESLGILARLPSYYNRQNPKAVRALLKKVSELSGLSFDLTPLDRSAALFESDLTRRLSANPENISRLKELEKLYDTNAALSHEVTAFIEGLDIEGLKEA